MSTPPTKPSKNSKLPTPFSLRLTFEERAALEQSAGNRPLGAYIRSKLWRHKSTEKTAQPHQKAAKRRKSPGRATG